MAEDKDFELVREFVAGSEIAFNKIVGKYQHKIYWHARRMLGDHLDADEVTQEVLIVIYKKLNTFNFKSSLFTWIYKITSTRSLNQLKRRKLRKIFFLDEKHSNLMISDSDIISGVENMEKLRKLETVLNKLPVKQREIFILRSFEGLSYEEISKIKSKSIGGLKANYYHALKKILELMHDE